MSRRGSHWPSRVLHAVDEWSGRAWLAATLSAATLVVLVVLVLRADDTPLVVFAAVVQAVTLVLVFAVQHTQNRSQRITQRKLDEILHALEGTDPQVVHLEAASDREIDELTDRHRSARAG